jgi:hypothetical protein
LVNFYYRLDIWLGPSAYGIKREKCSDVLGRAGLANTPVEEWPSAHGVWIGLARTIYIRCMYGIFSRELAKYTVIYGVYIRF